MRLETPQSALTASDGRWTGGTAIVAIRRPDVIAIGIDSLSQDIRSGKATRVRKICYANGVVFASAGVTSIETIPFDIRRLAAGSLKGNNLADKVASFEQAARQPMRAVFEYLRQTNTQPPHESLGPGKPILSIVFASQMAGTLAPFSKDYDWPEADGGELIERRRNEWTGHKVKMFGQSAEMHAAVTLEKGKRLVWAVWTATEHRFILS